MTTEITILTGQGERQVFPPPPPASFLKRLTIRVVAGLILLAGVAAILLVFAVALPVALAVLITFGAFVLLIVAIAWGRQLLQRIGLIKPRPGIDMPLDQRENVRVRRHTTASDVIDPPQ